MKIEIDYLENLDITNDELVLPGLGVILELFWNNLNIKQKKDIAIIIKNNLNKK